MKHLLIATAAAIGLVAALPASARTSTVTTTGPSATGSVTKQVSPLGCSLPAGESAHWPHWSAGPFLDLRCQPPEH